MDDVKVAAIIAAVVFSAMSWIWSVARAAKSCAEQAETDVAKQGVEVKGLGKRIDELRQDQRDGFAGVHSRLDKIVNGS